jgi:hypothetical protein
MMFSWFENDEPQNVERPLGMPTVKDPIDADQENALQDGWSVGAVTMQTWNVTLHGATSWDLE